jgi:KDO2-lipid IV(A) lauroyltransferase
VKERLAKMAVRILETVPLPLLAAVCEAAMLLVWAIDRRHRRIARINLRIAFPEMGDAQASRIVRRCYRQLGTSAAEFAHLPRMDEAYIRDHVRIEGIEHARPATGGVGRPTLVMTGHFGNWELQSHAYARLFGPMAFIVRPLRDGVLDRMVTERRELAGNIAIRKEDSAKEVMKLLRRGVLVGILIDQNVDRAKGLPVELFTRTAYTTFGIARLALAMRAAIVSGFIYRDPERKFHHVLRFGPPVEIDYDAPREDEVARVTRRCNGELEKAVREAPEMWMWFQKRWKTRPEGEPEIYGDRR